jgi:hypothetical protein
MQYEGRDIQSTAAVELLFEGGNGFPVDPVVGGGQVD